MLPSSKMCSVPGRPSAAPVMTTGTLRGPRVLAAIDLPAALENVGEQVAEFGVVIAVRRLGAECGGIAAEAAASWAVAGCRSTGAATVGSFCARLQQSRGPVPPHTDRTAPG